MRDEGGISPTTIQRRDQRRTDSDWSADAYTAPGVWTMDSNGRSLTATIGGSEGIRTDGPLTDGPGAIIPYNPLKHALDAKFGIGGAPTRATTLPEGAAERKTYPVASGVLDYFPDALVAVANVSWKGNEQHNPGQPLNWARGKSPDEADTMIRHFLQRGTMDIDGIRHSAKMVWRALAFLQKEIEGEKQ